MPRAAAAPEDQVEEADDAVATERAWLARMLATRTASTRHDTDDL